MGRVKITSVTIDDPHYGLKLSDLLGWTIDLGSRRVRVVGIQEPFTLLVIEED